MASITHVCRVIMRTECQGLICGPVTPAEEKYMHFFGRHLYKTDVNAEHDSYSFEKYFSLTCEMEKNACFV